MVTAFFTACSSVFPFQVYSRFPETSAPAGPIKSVAGASREGASHEMLPGNDVALRPCGSACGEHVVKRFVAAPGVSSTAVIYPSPHRQYAPSFPAEH